MSDTALTNVPDGLIQTAYDMKAVVILTCCDLIKALSDMGDERGAYALKVLVETIEHIPASTLNSEEADHG